MADSSNHRVRLITVKDKKVTTLAGSGTAGFADGTGTNAKFNGPRGVAISADASIVVVADKGNHRVRMITESEPEPESEPPPPPASSGAPSSASAMMSLLLQILTAVAVLFA